MLEPIGNLLDRSGRADSASGRIAAGRPAVNSFNPMSGALQPVIGFHRAVKTLLPPLSVLLLALLAVPAPAETLAFPSAEGFGAYAKGGRGGKVLFVTNLNKSGPGSLREACEAEGARTIIFQVGGTIDLKRNIYIRHPYVTIAGQTALGDGICLRGAGLIVQAHDVIIRGLRIRPGDDPEGPHPASRDAIWVGSDQETVERVIIDHCSLSWAIDENASTWYPVLDITFQWNIISEGLMDSLHPKGPHSMGLLVGDHSHRVSLHHNLFAHNNFRNPSLKGDTVTEIVNNTIYNWGSHAMGFSQVTDAEPSSAILIGNLFIPGPNSRTSLGGFDVPSHASPKAQLFSEGNRSTVEMKIANPRVENREAIVDTPPFPGSGIRIQPAQEASLLVLSEAGATLPHRDSVDSRIVAEVQRGTGQIIDSQSEVGGWPTYRSASPPADSDQDGMPDEWEAKFALSPGSMDNNADEDGDGYTNLEEFLNATNPTQPN